ARFKEIGEAYETLGDDKKRATYDELRRNPFAGAPGAGPFAGGGFGGGGVNVDLSELLNRMRGEVRQERARAKQQQRAQQGPPLDGFDLFEMFGGGGMGGEPRRAQQPSSADVVAKLDLDLPEAALGAEKELAVDGKHLKVKIPAGVTDGKTIRLQ